MQRFGFSLVTWSLCAATSAFGQYVQATGSGEKHPPPPAIAAAATSSSVCSSQWLGNLEKKCYGAEPNACAVMLEQARVLLDNQGKTMSQVLTEPDEFIVAHRAWLAYRDAECRALETQCPEGQSGSCNLPTAICEARLNCDQITHLRAAECRTNVVNRSLQAPPKPESCTHP